MSFGSFSTFMQSYRGWAFWEIVQRSLGFVQMLPENSISELYNDGCLVVSVVSPHGALPLF